MEVDVRAINEKIERESAFVDLLTMEMSKVIVGQKHMIDRLLIGLLGNGHILLEGVPGLAKTLAINTLAKAVDGAFSRIQFTPDLLPADLTGTEIYRPQKGTFEFREGPLFHNLILADEINRAPAKVQSALLEAMEERQISVGDKSYELSDLFLVMATQNPIEQEGTYPLPEAQLDRFLLHVEVGYPSLEDEQSKITVADLNVPADVTVNQEADDAVAVISVAKEGVEEEPEEIDMDEFNPAILIAEYGFTTVAIVAMAYFVFYIWKFINDELDPKLEEMHMGLIRLIDQVRMLDQDMIRLQEKVKVVLEYRERQKKINESEDEKNKD